MTNLVCKHCGGGMEGKLSSAMFCSSRCRNARWRAANPEKVREQSARWRAANPEAVKEGNRMHYAKRRFMVNASINMQEALLALPLIAELFLAHVGTHDE